MIDLLRLLHATIVGGLAGHHAPSLTQNAAQSLIGEEGSGAAIVNLTYDGDGSQLTYDGDGSNLTYP